MKSVVLSQQTSIRTHGEDKDGDLSAFLCKFGICTRLGEIPKFFLTSATLKSLRMVGKMHPKYNVGGRRALQEEIMLFLSVQTTARAVFLDYVYFIAW